MGIALFGFLFASVKAECLGTPTVCDSHTKTATCNKCGCDWEHPHGPCSGHASVCSSHSSRIKCEDCGCVWSEVSEGGGAISAKKIKFSGRAFPNAKIIIVVQSENQEIPFRQEQIASADGQFFLEISNIPGGTKFKGLGATIIDENGKISSSQIFSIDNSFSEYSIVDNVFLPPTIGFAKAVVGKNEQLMIEGFAFPNNKVKFVVDEKEIKEESTSGENGYYKLLLSVNNLDYGRHSIKAKQIDSSGTNSGFSQQRVFVISEFVIANTKMDLNGDGLTNTKDWSEFLAKWKEKDYEKSKKVDFNNDGKVDIADFSIFIGTIRK